ncbi:MAG: hypothetical protein ABL876_01820 [Chitinophagaceae bacterium]
MKEKNISSNLLSKLLLVIVVSSVVFFNACKDGGTPSGGGAPRVFKLNCVTLSRAQVQAWVDSGWTNPNNPDRITKLLFQFYSQNGTMANSNMQLVVYPGKTLDDVHITGKALLSIDTTCASYSLSGTAIFSNNEFSLEKLGILNPDGTLNDFDYIRFTPEQYPKNPDYLNYKIEVVRKGTPTEVEGDGTWPCPPYCD